MGTAATAATQISEVTHEIENGNKPRAARKVPGERSEFGTRSNECRLPPVNQRTINHEDQHPDQLSGRDHHLIGRALYVAARALRGQEHPPLSDIQGMNELLDRYYPRDKEMYDWQTKLQLAMRLGFEYQPGKTREDVERWIAEHLPDDNVSVVALHSRRAEHDGSQH